MKLSANPNKTEELYNQYFKEINKIKFTSREIDVISCVLHNRGEKKIAYILSIAPRTVSSHIRNIMQKLNCNSKEGIIDFIEKAGKLKALRLYYINLSIMSAFKNSLIKIGKLFNKAGMVIRIVSPDNYVAKEFPILRQLEEHLSLAKININITNERETGIEQSFYLDLFMDNSVKKVKLIFDKAKTSKVIDFREENNYYFLVLELLETIIKGQELNKTSEEFRNHYKNLCKSCDEPSILGDIQTEFRINGLVLSKNLMVIFTISICLLFIIIITAIKLNKVYTNKQEIKQKSKREEVQIISNNISILLPKFFKDLSIRNLTKEEAEKNYSIIKQFDGIIKKISGGQIGKYFNSDILNSQELVNCLYNLNAISSYALFKEHNTAKAEALLKYAKSLAERHIANRSRLPIPFDKLSLAETYTELSIVKDLPEMYTITMYFLGRNYIYNKNIELAQKNFKISRYLGEKLKLFEGVLSVVNGLAITAGDQADVDIKSGEYARARNRLIECVNIYKKMKEEGNVYKKNYRPSNSTPTIIIPKNDIYHVVDCTKRIIKLYIKLIAITDNIDERNNYIKDGLKQFIGNHEEPGVLEILAKSENKITRIAADSYNSIGYFLLRLSDENINFEQFKKKLIVTLGLKEGDNLAIIYQVFDRARALSRSTEFTKADSYDGLTRVYERLLGRDNTGESERTQLLLDIQRFKAARDAINNALSRDTTYGPALPF